MYLQLRLFLRSIFYKTPFVWKFLEFIQGLFDTLKYFFYYKFWGHNHRSSLKEFYLEFSSQCNLRCNFCSLDHLKPKEWMSEETLNKALEDLISDKRFSGIDVIYLHNGGETLLHPKRIEMMAVIKKYKLIAQERNITFPKVSLLTNGMLLREKMAQQIIDLGIIDEMGVSMDGGTGVAYEEMRARAKWPRFKENINKFCELNRSAVHPVKTYCICCIPDDKPLNTSWMDEDFVEVLENLDRYELRRLHNWAGQLEEEMEQKEKNHKIGCSALLNQFVLLPNGDVTVCCSDLNSKGVIGNIKDQSMYEVYKSPERLRYVDLLFQGKKKELDLCKDCETF